MLAAIIALAPIILEILKLFMGSGKSDQEKIKEGLLKHLSDVREALKKAKDTGGDTSDIEQIINRRS